jgi:hypothetical protein
MIEPDKRSIWKEMKKGNKLPETMVLTKTCVMLLINTERKEITLII